MVAEVHVTRRKRQLAHIRDQALYLFTISVHGGFDSISLDFRDLGLNAEVVATLQRSDITPGKMPLFRDYKRVINKLSGHRAKIYRRFTVYLGDFYAFPEPDFPAVLEELEAMQAELEEYKAEVVSAHAEGRKAFIERVSAVLTAAGLSEAEVERGADRYASRFPTVADIHEKLRIDWVGPIRIPSLKEQAKEESELAAALAVEAEAEEKTAALYARQQLQQEWVNKVRARFDAALAGVQDEVFASIAEVLEPLSTQRYHALSSAKRKVIEERLERLQSIVNLDGAWSEIFSQVSGLVEFAKNNHALKVQQQIVAFRQQLRSDFSIDASSGQGHRALAEWLMF